MFSILYFLEIYYELLVWLVKKKTFLWRITIYHRKPIRLFKLQSFITVNPYSCLFSQV